MNANYYEEDYRPVTGAGGSGRFLPDSSIEIIREKDSREPPLCSASPMNLSAVREPEQGALAASASIKHVLFDFDGTLSLVREGWVDVMVPLMVEILTATGTQESLQTLTDLAREFVMELTGKQTIYQMIRLAEEVTKRGGTPKEPIEYKQMYHDRLMERIASRREALRSGQVPPDEMLVPGSRELLDELRRRDVAVYVASGTDEPYVIEEVRLLKLDEYFGPHVYGARDDFKAFSKAMVIERILKENRVPGAQLLGFGDGYVEIQNIKSVGGVAVAVASDEANRSGKPDAWKRERLIGAGADIVIPDFQEYKTLLDYLAV